MGLDQYGSARKEGEPEQELAYWRKHPNLQGWMEQLYREKGGEGVFNCVDVELTFEDLEKLETAIEDAELPSTEGFLFGRGSDVQYRENDLAFIADASEAIDQGYTVFYTSWW